MSREFRGGERVSGGTAEVTFGLPVGKGKFFML